MKGNRWHTARGYLFLIPYATVFACFTVLPLGVALVLAYMQVDLASVAPAKMVWIDNFKEA